MTEAQVPTQGLSEAGRLAGIFWEPKSAFQDLAARPRFWVPLILLTLLSVVYIVSFSRVVGLESIVQRQFESNPRLQQMPAEQRERAIEQGMKFAAPMTYAGSVFGVAISTLLVAAVLLACFNLLGGAELKYKTAFSITCYSFLPSGLASILAMVVMFLKNPADFDIQHPLPLNVGAFLSTEGSAAWLRTLAGSIDLFTVWIILLLALGFSVAGKRISFAKALVLVVLPWAVVVLGRVGLAAISG